MHLFLIIINYIFLFTPAFSLSQLILGMNFGNRFLLIPLMSVLVFTLKKTIFEFHFPILLLLFFFYIYFMISFVDNRNFTIYFGYVLFALYLLLSSILIKFNQSHFLVFFKIFFLSNVLYVVFQLIVLNMGFSHLSMIHCNMPSKVDYTIPVFITKPFFRFTGLFGESSPFAFYLSICYSFFTALGDEFKWFKICAFITIIIAGSKAGYLFLALHLIISNKSKILKIISSLTVLYIIYLYLVDYTKLSIITHGQTSTIKDRIKGFDFSNISLFGTNMYRSTEGEVALNFFDIIGKGYGIFGIVFILTSIYLFYILIKNPRKKYFIAPFVVGLISNGSLLIPQYTLIFYCLIYLNFNKNMKKNEIWYSIQEVLSFK